MKRIMKICIAGALLFGVLAAVPAVTRRALAAEAKTVYISDAGSDGNSGASAARPKKNLSAAFSALGTGGGTVVVCGKLTLSSAGGFNFPSCSGEVRITSVDATADYTKTAGAQLAVSGALCFSSDLTIENVKISAASEVKFYCRGNNITFGDGISVSCNGTYPTIYGGVYCGLSSSSPDGCSFYDYTIRIKSGTWLCVRGGNYRDDESQPVGHIGGVSLIIDGGAFIGTGNSATHQSVISATSYCGLDGDAKIEINGGIFSCSVLAIGRQGANNTYKIASFSGNVSVVITGGRFACTRIAAVQETISTKLEGDFDVKISGGTFTGIFTAVQATNVLGFSRAEISVPAAARLAVGFARTVFLSDTGNDANDGLSEDRAVKTVAAAAKLIGDGDGVLVVCGNAVLDTGTECDRLLITSTWCGKEYNAVLTVAGNVECANDLTLSGINIKAENQAVLAVRGGSITAGEGITVSGSLTLDCGKGDGTAQRLTVHSGDYAALRGGSSAGGTAVVLYGGTAERVYGASGEYSGGNATVIVLGGGVKNGITAAERGCGGDCGIAVYGGTVSGSVSAVREGLCRGDFGIFAGAGLDMSAVELNTKNVSGTMLFAGAESGTVMPEGFTDAGKAVFVTDGGNGDGSTPLSPAGGIYTASKDLRDTGGAIVLLGDCTLKNDVTLPAFDGTCVFGGKYCGADYRTAFGSRLRLAANISFGTETTVCTTDILALNEAAYISANSKKTTVAADVSCDKYTARGVRYYPSLCGGVAASSGGYGGTKSTDLTVCGGTWNYVYGGNIRVSSESGSGRTVTGEVKLNITGGAFYGGVSANGMNNLKGTAELEISGGVFHCPVYGTAAANVTFGSEQTVNGDISVYISGGEFCGDILPAQRTDEVKLIGTYTLSLMRGDFSRINSISGAENLQGYGTDCRSVLNIAKNIDLNKDFSGEIEFTNPIASYADPSVYYCDGWYYYTYSKDYLGKPALWLARSANLCDIGASEPLMVWSGAVSGVGGAMTSLWAPQIYRLDGKWYIYATCSKNGTSEVAQRRPYVWVGLGDTPYDGFEYYGTLDNYDDEAYSYLSPRIIEHGGVRYLVCGGFFREEDRISGVKHYQRLFIGELASPTAFSTGMTVISYPTESWEIDGKVSIQEGPFPLYAPDGTLFLAYAAGQTLSNEYCTGLLKYLGGASDSLSDPQLWEKQKKPLQFVDYDTGVYSPGAMVIVPSPDGQTLWGVFHVKCYAYTVYTHRILFAQPISFTDNYPAIAAAQPVDTVWTIKKNTMPLASRMGSFGEVNYEEPLPEPVTEPVTEPGTEPSGNPGDGTSSFPVIPVVCAGAALAVCGTAAGLLAARKKKKKS